MSKYHKLLLLTIALLIAAVWIVTGGHKYVFSGPTWELRKGLDLAGGVRVVLQGRDADLRDANGRPLKPEDKARKMEAVINTIRTRVGGISGVAEPTVSKQGEDRVLVELPGLKNKQEAIDLIKETARLEFYYLRDVQSPKNQSAKWQMLDPRVDPKTGADIYDFENSVTHEIIKGDTPEGQKKILREVVNAYDAKENPTGVKPFLSGDDLQPNAKGDFGGQGNAPVIKIQFNSKGTEIFAEFTRRHVDERTAIVLNGVIVTAPTVIQPIPNGQAEITGFNSLEQAEKRAQLLNSGALPVELTIVQMDDVQATLGKETVSSAVKAGLIGLLLVLLFMLIVYRLPGLLADVALGIYSLLTLAAFTVIGVTMTLPGLAAFILSIGMAVDANILIFERLKEELRSGKTLHAAIDAGFSRAFTAIFDSNMCTIITALILMKLGTGTVQSFAFTLIIGVLISMFTAILVTRSFLHLLVSMQWAQKPGLFGLGASWFTRKGFNIVGRRNLYFAISALIIIPGVIFYFLNYSKIGSGLKPGIEFKPGTNMQVTFQQAQLNAKFAMPLTVTPEAVQDAVSRAGTRSTATISGDTATIFAALGPDNNEDIDAIKASLVDDEKLKPFGPVTLTASDFSNTPKTPVLARDVERMVEELGYKNAAQVSRTTPGKPVTVFVRTDQMKDIQKGTDDITRALEEKYGTAKVASSSVGPTISKELTQNAILAVILAMAAIVIYLAFRFAIGGFVDGLKYGVTAVTATFHDVLVITGLFAIAGHFLGWEIDTLFVTAVLTMIGFSTHDTIVVFDRIRENMKHRLRGENFEALANRSILQTFTRSINTSFTVLLTIIALTIFGGGGLSIRHMYIALLIGIISGTYSSIFNATPLLVVWEGIANRAKSGGGPRRLADDKTFVAPSDVKPVARAAAAPGDGAADEDERVVPSGGGAERVKVKPKKKKRRY